VVTQLRALCATPVHTCVLPGRLVLPRKPCGTLVLLHVEALTIDQQIALYDWMSASRQVQVVSIAGAPLLSLVEHGQFLEGLFHRLNTVALMATGSDARWATPSVDNMQIAWWRR
jgi:hypothetical protein